MDYDYVSFEEMRYECNNHWEEKNEKLINEWCKKCGVVEPVGYYNDTSKHKMYIYTNKCGILIGKAGCMVNEFKEALKKEFSVEYKVEFVEIRGGFANVSF